VHGWLVMSAANYLPAGTEVGNIFFMLVNTLISKVPAHLAGALETVAIVGLSSTLLVAALADASTLFSCPQLFAPQLQPTGQLLHLHETLHCL
jgi:hypothetical protein